MTDSTQRGWRLGAAASGGVTAAALDDAVAKARDASARLDAARPPPLPGRPTMSAQARRAVHDATQRRRENETQLSAGTAALGRAEGRRREADAELAPLDFRVEELEALLATESTRIAELEQVVPSLEAGERAEADAAQERRAVRTALDARAAVLVGPTSRPRGAGGGSA